MFYYTRLFWRFSFALAPAPGCITLPTPPPRTRRPCPRSRAALVSPLPTRLAPPRTVQTPVSNALFKHFRNPIHMFLFIIAVVHILVGVLVLVLSTLKLK